MKKPLLKRLTSASAAVMMLFMQLLTLPAEQLIPAVAEEIVTSDRGALIASNYRLLKDGKDIKDGVEVAQGDELTLAFDWRINNNEDYTVYEATIDLIDISFAEKSGQIYEEGEAIADFIIEPTDDGKFKFVAHFDTEKTANKSNIGGGAIIDASVDADAERKLPDRSEIKLAFGDKLANAVYRNPGSVDGVKTAGKLRDGGDGTYYIDYSLSFKLRDIMESPVISDDLDDSTELDMSSLKLSLNGNDVTADPAYTIT